MKPLRILVVEDDLMIGPLLAEMLEDLGHVVCAVEVDAAVLTSQADLETRLRELANADLVLDVRVVGVRAADLDLSVDELERQLGSAFMRIRVRDASIAPLADTVIAPQDTILGAFTRNFRTRIEESEANGDAARAAELREALRLGTLLLDDPQRVTLA